MASGVRLLTGSSSASNWTSVPRLSRLLLLLSTVSVALCFAIYRAYATSQPYYPPGSLAPDARGGGAGSCRMSFMSPSYFHLSGFGSEFTRLGNGPWGLYLYREAGWDDEPMVPDGRGGETMELTGVPVLFVPGNAGSFRQVRSLAGATSRAYFELPGVRRKGIGTRDGGSSLDFFTIDFNDDFSAFHGQTLLDQAEYTADCIRYILGLYANRRGKPDPTSVIVVAHSMGGIVARAAFLSPQYQSRSISTLITFATPHLVPPITVDPGVNHVYAAVNSYWREAYSLSSSTSSLLPLTHPRSPAHEELSDLILVSISGGLSDDMIASESASLSSLVPADDSNGFAVSTTAIPGVQTPIDHLAILWCQQLMQTVAEALLAVVDARTPDGVATREHRVAELSSRLLGGLERARSPVETAALRTITFESVQRGQPSKILKRGERLALRREGEKASRTTFLMPIPRSRTYVGPRTFSLLTSASVGRRKEDAVEVYICTSSPLPPPDDHRQFAPSPTDACTALYPQHVTLLPSSRHSSVSPVLPAAVEDDFISLVSLDADQLEGRQFIAIVVKGSGEDWVLAEFGDRDKQVQVVQHGALRISLGGFRLEAFPSTPAMVSELWLPALDNSLLALSLRVYRSNCQEHTSLFAPLLRQYSPALHESKYFPNVRHASLYTHSSGPYLPPPISPFALSGTRLQFFLDPTCPSDSSKGTADLAIEVKVDWRGTLGALVVRYRMAMVTVPFAVVVLVVWLQIRDFNAGDPFPPFGIALATFSRKSLPQLLLVLLALSYLQSILLNSHLSTHEALASAEPGHLLHSHLSLPPAWLADALLGNTRSFWAPLAPFLVFALLGIVAAEYAALSAIVSLMAWAVRKMQAKGPWRMDALLSTNELGEPMPTQRILTMAGLLLLVVFFAPYQFAFTVIVLVHLFSTVRSLILALDETPPSHGARTPPSPASTAAVKRLWDRYHYSFSILFVLVTLLPINALILVVWVRNLAVGWLAPFSSDHNVIMVVGFLANVEALHSGKMLQRSSSG
ncbi:hypothetical protein JCM1841_004366, partial [Sporobolomyces salmonicolor]